MQHDVTRGFRAVIFAPVLLISLFYNLRWEYDRAMQLYPIAFQASASVTFLIVIFIARRDVLFFKPRLIDYLVFSFILYAVFLSVWKNGNVKYWIFW